MCPIATTDETKRAITDYWFRSLMKHCSHISIQNLSKIIVEYGAICEKFDESFIDNSIILKQGGLSLIKPSSAYNGYTGFGSITAVFGQKYHWRIKLTECDDIDPDVHIGIIAADKCKANDDNWWNTDYGYSYWSDDGMIYHNNNDKQYGDNYGKHDIIDIFLDLQNNKKELSFAKNNQNYGKAHDVKESMEYKLVITIYGNSYKVELMTFELC